jgi:hypothetical protein
MKKEITTAVVIKAEPGKVWNILTDFTNYPQWNPFIRSIKGQVQVGNTITARIEPPQAKGMTFKPVVLVFEPNKEFRWKGKLLVNGLFDGEHSFELIDNRDGTTTFIHKEKFSGLLVPLFKNMLDHNTRAGFNAMNHSLKLKAEQTV